ncbi:hypothetical protein [Humisphaera borealis]|uniref:Uncharacterized protein n=1 Tax=Humisphaera borealis TaxID=2807512 RepID=A0A7M2WXR1_9BACT|nr:hypothetical protein [Humisphaera borealis]QOV90193.1 hypothetical protein IPV69_02125 [Humisphaera borealis]
MASGLLKRVSWLRVAVVLTFSVVVLVVFWVILSPNDPIAPESSKDWAMKVCKALGWEPNEKTIRVGSVGQTPIVDVASRSIDVPPGNVRLPMPLPIKDGSSGRIVAVDWVVAGLESRDGGTRLTVKADVAVIAFAILGLTFVWLICHFLSILSLKKCGISVPLRAIVNRVLISLVPTGLAIAILTGHFVPSRSWTAETAYRRQFVTDRVSMVPHLEPPATQGTPPLDELLRTLNSLSAAKDHHVIQAILLPDELGALAADYKERIQDIVRANDIRLRVDSSSETVQRIAYTLRPDCNCGWLGSMLQLKAEQTTDELQLNSIQVRHWVVSRKVDLVKWLATAKTYRTTGPGYLFKQIPPNEPALALTGPQFDALFESNKSPSDDSRVELLARLCWTADPTLPAILANSATLQEKDCSRIKAVLKRQFDPAVSTTGSYAQLYDYCYAMYILSELSHRLGRTCPPQLKVLISDELSRCLNALGGWTNNFSNWDTSSTSRFTGSDRSLQSELLWMLATFRSSGDASINRACSSLYVHLLANCTDKPQSSTYAEGAYWGATLIALNKNGLHPNIIKLWQLPTTNPSTTGATAANDMLNQILLNLKRPVNMSNMHSTYQLLFAARFAKLCGPTQSTAVAQLLANVLAFNGHCLPPGTSSSLSYFASKEDPANDGRRLAYFFSLIAAAELRDYIDTNFPNLRPPTSNPTSP